MSYQDLSQECRQANATLVAVSKTKPISAIEGLYAQGQRIFGENRIEEMLEKKEALPDDIEWHFIGTLQTKKVKKLIPNASLIHSVDSIKLLDEINKRSEQHNVVTSLLLQVKIAKEESKHGLDATQLMDIMNGINKGGYPNIHCRGMMGMATFTDDKSTVSSEFEYLKSTFDQAKRKATWQGFDTLSMGMSGDYKLALEHGSTMVRIGSLLFGAREYV